MAKQQKQTFYRKHDRVVFDGSHPDTGEILPSMTKQEFKKECDINNILKQYSVTGMLTHVSARARMGTYEDLPDPLDFQESLNLVEDARRRFMTLPAALRDRFGQDPSQFLAFCADPQNADELVKLGLANAPPAPIVEAPPPQEKKPE